MTDVKLSFKTDEMTINIDTLIHSLSSVKTGMKSILGDKISFQFNHTKIACFEISMTINDSYDTDVLFEHRKENTYSDYVQTLYDIISLKEFHLSKKYIKSIKKLLKTISNQDEDVEMSFQNDDENFIKTIYIDNSKAKKSYIEPERRLPPPDPEINSNSGKITTISISKRLIGVDCNCTQKEIEFKINDKIIQDIVNKRYEIGDNVEFSVEKRPHKQKHTLLYLSNTTKTPTLF